MRVILACASNDQGEQRLFGSVPVEADRQRQQLSPVLRDLGARPTTPVTVLSDGAEGPRFLGETASPGPTRHVLDWFHLSMRVRVTQTARSWPRATKENMQHGDVLSKKIERIPLAAMARPTPRSSGSDQRNLAGACDAKTPNPADRSLPSKSSPVSCGTLRLMFRAIHLDHKLCRRTAFGRTNIDGANQGHAVNQLHS